jgi:FixJ family two-component response regulator
MNISEKTAKVHRATMMEKLKARSTAELVRMAERLQPLHH